MHHLLITLGSHGDTHPFIGLGRELVRRGHRVTLIANEMFQPLADGVGLEFAPLGSAEEFRQGLAEPDLWHPVRGFRAVFELGVLPLMKQTFERIRERYVPGETAVTAHAIAFGARVAREVLGVPLVTVHLAPAVFRGADDPPRFAGAGFMRRLPAPMVRGMFRLIDWAFADPVVAGPVNAFRAEFGLAPVKRIINDWWMSPDRVVALFPKWFAPPRPDWPERVRVTGFPLYDERGLSALPAELEGFLQAGSPPVAFTFGSAMTHAAKQMAASVEACRIGGLRGLLLTRHREQLPPNLPPCVRHFDYAPFSELLPRCAALVHHGGIGTTAQALAAGVPQLVMPLAHDQHDNAARVRGLGVGAELSPRAYRAKKVAATLRRLLEDPGVHARCRAVAERFAGTDPIAETCDWIERAATRADPGPARR
jgi:UDP:flavonoid glycosyltransferase YjiC (YdhE family)